MESNATTVVKIDPYWKLCSLLLCAVLWVFASNDIDLVTPSVLFWLGQSLTQFLVHYFLCLFTYSISLLSQSHLRHYKDWPLFLVDVFGLDSFSELVLFKFRFFFVFQSKYEFSLQTYFEMDDASSQFMQHIVTFFKYDKNFLRWQKQSL